VFDQRRRAIELFAPLGPTYDRVGAVLSLGQDPRWRRFLVGRLPQDGGRVLDVATGTGLVAHALLERGFHVTGLDQSAEMLDVARARLAGRAETVQAHAEELPFETASFDHLTVTYLLRYVDDPAATMRELSRVVRPGGTLAMLEFGVPRGIWYPLWRLYVGVGLPLAGRLISRGWYDVGRFLGGSISDFWRELPEQRLLDAWQDAGVVAPCLRRLSVGGGVVVWGTKRGGVLGA
jgi:demethylmenaquinone methyltransferase / 2-methoxy-6-polyprenyl-1,4-benzoquinol methylase